MEDRRRHVVMAGSVIIFLRSVPLEATIVCTTHHSRMVFLDLLRSHGRSLLLEHDGSHILHNLLDNVIVVQRLSTTGNRRIEPNTRSSKLCSRE